MNVCSGGMLSSKLRGCTRCVARGSPAADGTGVAADCKQFLYIRRAAFLRVGDQRHLSRRQEVQPGLRVEVAAASGVGMLAPSQTCMSRCMYVCMYGRIVLAMYLLISAYVCSMYACMYVQCVCMILILSLYVCMHVFMYVNYAMSTMSTRP